MENQKYIETSFLGHTRFQDFDTKDALHHHFTPSLSDQSSIYQSDERSEVPDLSNSFPWNEDFSVSESPRKAKRISSIRNEIKGLNYLHKNVNKSREIHRMLQEKKHRWKPSELELTILKLNFDKSKYPSKEEKEHIIKMLEEKVSSKITINQVSRWFQNERDKKLNNKPKDLNKHVYRKFTPEELTLLKNSFSQSNYPKLEEMKDIATSLNTSLSKIENWYKHNRRSLAKNGSFYLKSKKYFKREELNYLISMFIEFPRPDKKIITEIANTLCCDEIQIKNWYCNRRKKQKLINKKQIFTESSEDSLHQNQVPTLPQTSSELSNFYNTLALDNTENYKLQQNLATTTVPSTKSTNFEVPQSTSNSTLNDFRSQHFEAPVMTYNTPIIIIPKDGANINSFLTNSCGPIIILAQPPTNPPMEQIPIQNQNNLTKANICSAQMALLQLKSLQSNNIPQQRSPVELSFNTAPNLYYGNQHQIPQNNTPVFYSPIQTQNLKAFTANEPTNLTSSQFILLNQNGMNILVNRSPQESIPQEILKQTHPFVNGYQAYNNTNNLFNNSYPMLQLNNNNYNNYTHTLSKLGELPTTSGINFNALNKLNVGLNYGYSLFKGAGISQ